MEGETYSVDAWAKWQVSEWWRMNDRLTIVLGGLNLLDSRHQEHPALAARWIRRSVLATARVRF